MKEITNSRGLGLIASSVSVVLACAVLMGCDQKASSVKPSDVKSASSEPAATEQSQSSTSTRPGEKITSVRVEGTGKTFDDALQNALILAVEQVNGSRVAKTVNTASLVTDYHSQASASGEYSGSRSETAHADLQVDARKTVGDQSGTAHESGTGNANASGTVSGKYSASASDSGSGSASASYVAASSSTSGVIRRFQVASKREAQGQWYVTVVADIPVYTASVASKRLKIAVLPFRLANGQRSTETFEASVRSQVIDALSQSGKVAVLDRDYGEEDQGELAQLQDESFSKDEASKLGNKLGADYILVGTVTKAAASRDSVYMEAVGQRVYGATHASAQMTFRMIEAATGVVQLSATLSGSKYSGGSLDTVAKEEAADLTGKILDSLYPLRIEYVTDGVFYLGRGGDSIHVGDKFRVLRQGTPIEDSDTHEILGYSEKEIGKIVVTEVDSKLSKARLVDGSTVQVTDAKGLVARADGTSKDADSDGKGAKSESGGRPKAGGKAKHGDGEQSDSGKVKEGSDY
jgi:TolB-like protein